jgi:hypothetical protein
MVFYPAIKKNEIMSFAIKWMELETNVLSETSQSHKDKSLCFLLFVEAQEKQNEKVMKVRRGSG